MKLRWSALVLGLLLSTLTLSGAFKTKFHHKALLSDDIGTVVESGLNKVAVNEKNAALAQAEITASQDPLATPSNVGASSTEDGEITSFFSEKMLETPFGGDKTETITTDVTEPDAAASGYKAIYFKIIEYAQTLSELPVDEQQRKLQTGNLPNYYRKSQREMAKKMSESGGSANDDLMKHATVPYRFCVFPYFTTNSMSYCSQTYGTFSPKRVDECKCMMCLTCCDSLLPVLRFTAGQSVVSEILGLAEDAGYAKMKTALSMKEVNQCRQMCHKEYPMEFEPIAPTPAKDTKLGKTKDAPATSCMDILVNGQEAPSGIYWIAQSGKAPKSAYCDMDTDGGGWTLFFAYSHNPWEDYDINSMALPQDPSKSRSHMNLEDVGFSQTDILELRFYCTSDHQDERQSARSVHFKTDNQAIIAAAWSGDQQQMTPEAWKKDSEAIKTPAGIASNKIPSNTDAVSKSSTGGFWMNPFYINEQAYWSVKANTNKGGKWQCDDALNDEDGSKYKTLHQVWMRGSPPAEEFVRNRMQQRLMSAGK